MRFRFTKNRWYVSVASGQWKPTSSRSPPLKQTKGFSTEDEAKQFAKVMLSEGLKVTAGTFNPHVPKRRIITAAEIDKWIEEK